MMLRSFSAKPVTVLATMAVLATGALAQSFVYQGKYDCRRATNGRAYCKTMGGNGNYSPVPDEFFSQYEAARTGQPAPAPQPAPQVTQTAVSQTQNITVVNLQTDASDLRGQIKLLEVFLEEQKQLRASGDSPADVADQTIDALTERLSKLKENFHDKTTELSKYVTTIKPDDADEVITARKESEIQTKIPYYIQGTSETGEFWVEPEVSDEGKLRFKFQFVDVSSSAANQVRSTIMLSPDEMGLMEKALDKAGQNSKKAHDMKLARHVTARLVCFPDADCPPEDKKIDGKTSTEVIFIVFDDGSTGVRIQRNKGRFEEGYNVSIPSGLLLKSYIHHVLKAGQTEFDANTQSPEQLKALFK